MARMTRILEQMITAWNRAHHDAVRLSRIPQRAGTILGLQSYQYRLVEFRMGAKDRRCCCRPARCGSDARLKAALDAPGLL